MDWRPEEKRVATVGRTGKVPIMPMTLQQIMSEARQLPREQISQLFDLLLAESFAQPDPEIDAAWRSDVRRRINEIETGKVKGIPGDEVMAELRQIVGL